MTGPKKPGGMLGEDSPLNANSETRIAGDAKGYGLGEVIVGAGPRSGPLTTPPRAHWENRFTNPGQRGSAFDFERAFRMYRRRVYAKCLHMVGNQAEAEDLTQEVFLQVFRKRDSFRGESAFATWLYRVAVNVVLMRLRKKSLITSSLEEGIELKEGIFSLHQILGAPDRELTTAIDRLNLERAVAQIPAGYRLVFLLHYVEGYGHREIARILGSSIGTSKSQLYKARVRLRQLLRTTGKRGQQTAATRSRTVGPKKQARATFKLRWVVRLIRQRGLALEVCGFSW